MNTTYQAISGPVQWFYIAIFYRLVFDKVKNMNRLLLVPFVLLAFTQPAAAYLDPGTGSMILQGVIAGIAVVGLTIKNYWYKIRGFFGKESPTSLLDGDEESHKPEES